MRNNTNRAPSRLIPVGRVIDETKGDKGLVSDGTQFQQIPAMGLSRD